MRVQLFPALTAYLLFLTVLLGLAAGSFCNAWAWRLAHGVSIAGGRSHCTVCTHVLGVRDLIPLVSYFCLKGRCRYCGAPISCRYPAVEAVSAVFFVSIFLRFGLLQPHAALRWCLLGCTLLILSLVDWETRELPDFLILAVALLFFLRAPVEGWHGVKDGLIGAVAVSVPLLLFILLADKVTGRETMGGGDLKLFCVLGLHFGPVLTLLLLIVSCLAGIALGFAMARRGTREPGGVIPFVPAVAAATWPVILFGASAHNWYLGLFF